MSSHEQHHQPHYQIKPFEDNRRIDLRSLPWDKCTFYGRWKYYTWATDPRLSLATPTTVDQARELLRLYQAKKEPPCTTDELVIFAKRLEESSIHPDNGCPIPHAARFSSFLPSQLILTSAMVTFCRTLPSVWFWQLINNGYHANVNWANGNATAPHESSFERAASLGSAAVAASLVAIPFKSKLSRVMCRSKFRSLVPLVVVSLSHGVNVPLSRQNELVHGIDVYDQAGRVQGASRAAAIKGVCQVALSRMVLFAPAMIVIPLITSPLERKCLIQKNRWLVPSIQVLLSTALVTLMVPVSLALFSQTAQIRTETLEHIDPELHAKISRMILQIGIAGVITMYGYDYRRVVSV